MDVPRHKELQIDANIYIRWMNSTVKNKCLNALSDVKYDYRAFVFLESLHHVPLIYSINKS